MHKANRFLAAVGVIGVFISTNPNGICRTSQESSVLETVVESYHVEKGSMENALRSLRQKDLAKILIAFEKVARRENEPTESLSLSVNSTTVGEILHLLCQQSRQYTYEVVDGVIIYVHPTRGESDPLHLLDIKIKDFSLEGKMLPAAAVQRVGVLAPELAAYLAQKRSNYYASRGIVPGSPGATLGGNMDPNVNIHLHDLTVREILNQLVLYSVQLHDQMPPGLGGNKLPPTSWMYEFVIDPNAPTGLGGTPRWVAF